jgi:hypothetical protein
MVQFGCIPLFFDEPFQKSDLDSLVPGLDQQSIKEILGEPQAIRAGGKLWFYGKTRPVVLIIIPETGVTTEDYNWIELAFDDADKLAFVDVQEGKTGCTQSGNCLLWGAWTYAEQWESQIMTGRAIIAAPDKQDADAKRFLPNKDMCSIYIYFDSLHSTISRGFLKDDEALIQVTDYPAFFLNRDTYVRVESFPGNILIKVLGAETGYLCEADKIDFLFIHQPSLDFRDSHFNWVDQSEGQKSISKRRLLLAP